VPWIALFAVAAVGLAVFWPGLSAWFQLDDFAWLQIVRHTGHASWLSPVLRATPHGTWRPITDGLFFAVFNRLFGLDGHPYRVLVHATYALDVVLIGVLASRLGAGRIESALAALLFAVNGGLVVPMAWTCSYNQILAITFVVGGLLAWRAWCVDGGWPRYLLVLTLQLFGLFVLELLIVFPLVAALYVVCFMPRARWRALAPALAPLVLLAGSWALIHVLHAPPAKTGPYHAHIGLGMFESLWRYWRWTVLPPHRWETEWWRSLIPVIVGLALIAYAIAVRRHDRRPLFFAGLYVTLLLPALPLTDHVVENIVAAPALAFALWLAAFLAAVARRQVVARVAVAALVLPFIFETALLSHGGCAWWSANSVAIERVARVLMERRAHLPPADELRLRGASYDFLRFGYTGGQLFQALDLEPACVEVEPSSDLGLSTADVCGPPRASVPSDILSLTK
jgi:hypothetical protein